MKFSFSSNGWRGYIHWQSGNPANLIRLNSLIEECRRNPIKGTGRPEPLKNDSKGWWSRRLTSEDRLVYRATGTGPDQTLEIIQCRYHY